MENEQRLMGVAALLQVDHSVALMPLFTEETTRKGDEWAGGERWPLAAGQLEMISGRCRTERGESLAEAMRREAQEERGLTLLKMGQMVPETLTVGQERNGVPVEFLVHLFLSTLSEEQVSDLRTRHPVEMVGEDQVPTLLQEQHRRKLRPSVWAILQLACDNGFWREQ